MKKLMSGLTIIMLMVSTVAWAENESSFNFSTRSLHIPKVAVGAAYYDVQMQQQGQGLDFTVTGAAPASSSSSANVAAFRPGSLRIPTVVVGTDSYTIDMAQGQGLNFTVIGAVLKTGSVNISEYYPLCEGSRWQYNSKAILRRTALPQVSINGNPATPMYVSSDSNANKSSTYYRRVDPVDGYIMYGFDSCQNSICNTFRFTSPEDVPAQVVLGSPYNLRGEMIMNGVTVGGVSGSITVELGGSITTPAGTFTDTLKITEVHRTAGETTDSTVLEWWARGIGLVKHVELGTAWTEELSGANVCGMAVGTLVP